MTLDYLIVGLGNPGKEYADSRHNVGFMVLDVLGDGLEWHGSPRARAHYARTTMGTHEVELMKPYTMMNRSGEAVEYAVRKHAMAPECVIIVHDDVDLPLGGIKVSRGRSSGGHRGVASVEDALGTNGFVRVRVGIVPTTPTGKLRKPKGEANVLAHVMGAFKKGEEKARVASVKRATEAVKAIVTGGIERAMNQYN